MAWDDFPVKDETWCATFSHSVQLHWNQRERIRTIPIDPKTNTHVFMSSPGTSYARCSLLTVVKAHKISSIENTHAFYYEVTPGTEDRSLFLYIILLDDEQGNESPTSSSDMEKRASPATFEVFLPPTSLTQKLLKLLMSYLMTT